MNKFAKVLSAGKELAAEHSWVGMVISLIGFAGICVQEHAATVRAREREKFELEMRASNTVVTAAVRANSERIVALHKVVLSSNDKDKWSNTQIPMAGTNDLPSMSAAPATPSPIRVLNYSPSK